LETLVSIPAAGGARENEKADVATSSFEEDRHVGLLMNATSGRSRTVLSLVFRVDVEKTG
jgi:hypothetical protein